MAEVGISLGFGWQMKCFYLSIPIQLLLDKQHLTLCIRLVLVGEYKKCIQ